MTKPPYAILFVCTGNICRSPTAEAVFRQRIRERGLTAQFHHDSAGVASHHIGEAPDHRSQRATLARGIDMSDLRARDVAPEDYERFDLILAMDESHLAALKRKAPAGAKAELALYLPYSGVAGTDVPDPYFGGTPDFEHVYQLLDEATEALLIKLGH